MLEAANLKEPESAATASVLVIDDQPEIRSVCRAVLQKAGFNVGEAESGEDGLKIIQAQPVDVVLLDHQLPGISGLDLLKILRRKHSECEVIMMTAFGSFEAAVQAIKSGAYDFLSKPFKDNALILLAVRRALERKQLVERARHLEERMDHHAGSMIGNSVQMQKVHKIIEDVAGSDCTVLITGESGTGKELVARALHNRSSRRDRVMLSINCAALTESLLESELFGHVKGAFTGATGNKRGLFEATSGGTLFLDEIGDMTPATQVKLLRVLQEGEVRPVGGTSPIKVDVRVLAATNQPLDKLVREGKFRQELFYRLNVVNIDLPPLRERRDDISLLVQHFIQEFSRRYKKNVKSVSPEALEILEKHSWNGNVRELQHAIERAVVMSKSQRLEVEVLPPTLVPSGLSEGLTPLSHDQLLPYKQAKEQVVSSFTNAYVQRLLQKTGGNMAKAAALAGMERSNFRRLAEKAAARCASKKEHRDDSN